MLEDFKDESFGTDLAPGSSMCRAFCHPMVKSSESKGIGHENPLLFRYLVSHDVWNLDYIVLFSFIHTVLGKNRKLSPILPYMDGIVSIVKPSMYGWSIVALHLPTASMHIWPCSASQ